MRVDTMGFDEYIELCGKVKAYVGACPEPHKIRDVAEMFNLTIAETYMVAEDTEMIINVGVYIHGRGYHQEPHRGDYTLEVAGD